MVYKILMKRRKADIVSVHCTAVTTATLLQLNSGSKLSIFILIKAELRALFSPRAVVACFLQLLLVFFHTLSLLMLFLCCCAAILRAVKKL